MNKSTLHISYGEEEHYGKGDYLYSTVTFSGSKLRAERIFAVRELEELAAGNSKLAYEDEYSMVTSGRLFSRHKMTGIRLYELLLYAGLEEDAGEETELTLVSADGFTYSMSLSEIKNSPYNIYSAAGGELVRRKAPVILAFASDGVPLVGPVGARQPGDGDIEDGYVEEAGNAGGPVKLIRGQKNRDDANDPCNAKWLRRIIVGKDIDGRCDAETANKKCLETVIIDNNGKMQESRSFTYEELTSFPETEENYYGSENYYKGINLWHFITAAMGLRSIEGTVKLGYEDGSEDEINIEYFRNIKGDYDGYTTKKGGRLITNVKPALGYSVNGRLARKGIYALLPTAAGHVEVSKAKRLRSIEIVLAGADELTVNPYGNDKIIIDGSGVKKAAVITIKELESCYDLRVVKDGQMGISLAGLLERKGLTVDAEKVVVKGIEESANDIKKTAEVSFTCNELKHRRDEIILITRENGKPLAGGRSVRLGHINGVKRITVEAKTGQWEHDKPPYDRLSEYTLTVSGSEAAAVRGYTLRELEHSQYVLKDSFGASGGISGYAGIVLRRLVEDNLKPGIGKPGKISVISSDGYETILAVDDVMNGIDSQYQRGEHRDIIIAFSINGEPFVENESSAGFTGKNAGGPLRLVVENQMLKWVKGVKEVQIGV